MNGSFSQDNIIKGLLDWYDQHGRTLPWRAKRPQDLNLYYTVVSELMLQQTTVSTVLSYFQPFIERWPNFSSLAAASLDEVLHQWQGLGYYRRAKALWESAKILAVSVPTSESEWKKLPGFGPYTIAAVRSIALRHPMVAIDGNIKRIMARFWADNNEKAIALKAQSFAHADRTGDINQALMDIGSTICTPQAPQCLLCPLRTGCLAYATGRIGGFPSIKKRLAQPIRYGYAFVHVKEEKIALEKREGTGLLKGGLMGVPLSDFWPHPPGNDFTLHVKHTFTHFHLHLQLCHCQEGDLGHNIIWVPLRELNNYALPTLMKKIITFALKPPLQSFLSISIINREDVVKN